MDHVDFPAPVDVDGVMTVGAYVFDIDRISMDIKVGVTAERPSEGDRHEMLISSFTFVTLNDDEKPVPVSDLVYDPQGEREPRDAMPQKRHEHRTALAKKFEQCDPQAGRGCLFFVCRTDGQHRRVRLPDNVSGGGAGEVVIETGMTVGRRRDEVDVIIGDVVDDGRVRYTPHDDVLGSNALEERLGCGVSRRLRAVEFGLFPYIRRGTDRE